MDNQTLMTFGAIAVVVLVFLLLIGVLIKARKRRRAQFEELPTVAPEQVPEAPSEAEPADHDAAAIEPTAREAEAPEKPQAEPEAVTPPVSEPKVKVDTTTLDEAPEAQKTQEEHAEAGPPLERHKDEAIAAGLAKTNASLMGKLGRLFGMKSKLDDDLLDELEEALLSADLGVRLTMDWLDEIRHRSDIESADLRQLLRDKMLEVVTRLEPGQPITQHEGPAPKVILFVGVNGVGKTTTIGKLAAMLSKEENKKVVLAAGDTFRAAAAEQLGIWAERSGATLVRGEAKADPASVIFNAVDRAKQIEADIVLGDTAGRLHTKTDLMDEIKKVRKAAGKARPDAPDEVWLVVDSTTGQNALQQAKEFHQALELTGIVLTKLDGTAKGGVVIAIADALKIPIRYIGVGEKAEDLRPFDPESFVDGIMPEGKQKAA